MAAGSHLALFTFLRVRLYFSADSDGPVLTGQISGTQPLAVYLITDGLVFNVFLGGLDLLNSKPFPK